jgi:hypothetical protein
MYPNAIKIFPVLALLVALCACEGALADNAKYISLNSSEKAKAMELLERRQAVGIKRAKLAAQQAADSDRLNEEENQITIDQAQLCFELKKSHSIPPNVRYNLDEVNARLVKQ